MKVGVYCSGAGSRIRLFYNHSLNLKYDVEFSSICWDGTEFIVKDNIAELCRKNGLKYHVFARNESEVARERRQRFNDWIANIFEEDKLDYLFCFGSQIFDRNTVNEYGNRIINFHPSVLPMFPGLNAASKSLSSNALIVGNTAHFVREDVDRGPIVLQNIIFRSAQTTVDTILNGQLAMIAQIYIWLKNNRVFIDDERAWVSGGLYDFSGSFIPSLDIKW